jgi:CheY-like chemotaxis protein
MAEKEHILIVERDTALAQTMGLLLEHAGYRVQHTSQAEEGLVLARQLRPHLLLVDGAFGTLLAQLCDDEALRSIPVLLLAGMGEDPPASCPPVHAILEKPFKPRQLLAEVQALLAWHASAGEPATATILVVDDDPDFCQIVTRILQANGYRVRTAANGAEAWRQIQDEIPDLVLLDIMMSTVLDGLGVSQRMRQDPTLRHVPIVVVSSIADTEYAAVFPTDQYVHMDTWLSKPVDPESLLQAVRQHLSRQEA